MGGPRRPLRRTDLFDSLQIRLRRSRRVRRVSVGVRHPAGTAWLDTCASGAGGLDHHDHQSPSFNAMRKADQDVLIADVRAALSLGDLVEPPDWVKQRAKRLFRTGPAATSASFGARVRAALVFDSRRPGIAAAGVRSTGLL